MADSWITSIDVENYVKRLMEAEKENITISTKKQLAPLTKLQNTLTAEISSYGQLQQLLSTFQNSLQTLNNAFTTTYQSTVSVPSVASATVTPGVSPGNHTLVVDKLAQVESYASGTYTDNTSPLGISETLTLSIGDPSSPTASMNVTVNSTDSLQTIASNINANNIGVNASVVSTSDGIYQLVVASNQTGVANAVNITETPTVLGGQTIGLNTELSHAQDAVFTFDNLAFQQSSNSNTIAGINLTLLSEGTTNILLTPTNQVSTVVSAAQDVVQNYNQILTYIEQTQAQTQSPDPLLGSVQSLLQNAMGQSGNTSGIAHTLGAVGITFSQEVKTIPVTYANGTSGISYLNGLLQVDTDTLTEALTNNFSDIQALFEDPTSGIFTNMSNNVLNPGTGIAWKVLNDPQSGGVVKLNSRLAGIKLQIETGLETSEIQKDGLMRKYGTLLVMLSDLQTQSRYISAQIDVMFKK